MQVRDEMQLVLGAEAGGDVVAPGNVARLLVGAGVSFAAGACVDGLGAWRVKDADRPDQRQVVVEVVQE